MAEKQILEHFLNELNIELDFQKMTINRLEAFYNDWTKIGMEMDSLYELIEQWKQGKNTTETAIEKMKEKLMKLDSSL